MAARFWLGTTDVNWSNTANWSDSSGGGGGFSVPTSADDVTFDGAGNNPCTLNSSARVCLSLTVAAGYTNTITHSQQLTVSGNITLHSGYTIAGGGLLIINATSTITSGGQTWPNSLTLTGFTITLAADFTINGTLSSITANNVINGAFTIFVKGLVITTQLSGSSPVEMTGGNWSGTGNNSTGLVKTLRINGTCTLSGTNVTYVGNLTYVSGSLNTGSTNFRILGGGTYDVAPITFNNVELRLGTYTITLLSDFNVGSIFPQTNNATTFNTSVSAKVNVSVSLNVADNFGTGSADFVMLGGTWICTGGNLLNHNLYFQGNVTVSGNVYWGGSKSIFYTSGVVTTTGSTLNLLSSCTLDTFGIIWNTVSTSSTVANQTYTFNSELTCNALGLGIVAIQTYAGAAGFNTNTLVSNSTTAITINLKNGVTYTINTLFDCNKSRVGSIVLFTSSHASLRANILMPNNGSNACNVLANFTRIDASGGRSINSFNGTIIDCININSYQDYKPVAA